MAQGSPPVRRAVGVVSSGLQAMSESRALRRQHRLRAEGNCPICGLPRGESRSRYYCEICRIKHNYLARLNYVPSRRA